MFQSENGVWLESNRIMYITLNNINVMRRNTMRPKIPEKNIKYAGISPPACAGMEYIKHKIVLVRDEFAYASKMHLNTLKNSR